MTCEWKTDLHCSKHNWSERCIHSAQIGRAKAIDRDIQVDQTDLFRERIRSPRQILSHLVATRSDVSPSLMIGRYRVQGFGLYTQQIQNMLINISDFGGYSLFLSLRSRNLVWTMSCRCGESRMWPEESFTHNHTWLKLSGKINIKQAMATAM